MQKQDKKEILRLEDVNKAFGGVVAADHVSFRVRSGEITGLIGPNGAGKTTTLNLISGIYPVDSGKIYLDGQDVTNLPAYHRARIGIARTFQSPRFMHRSTIRENMMLGVDLANQFSFLQSFFGKKGVDLETETAEYLEIAKLKLNWDDDITALPYGHKKLLEIIRAMLAHPKVILVDEPAAGLNDKEIEHAIQLLQYAVKKFDLGIVLIEHKMQMIMNTCADIVVLDFGRVIANDVPEKIAKDPAVISAYLGG